MSELRRSFVFVLDALTARVCSLRQVHVTTGNGGPPSRDSFSEHCPGEDCHSIPATRKQSLEYGYGRLLVHNSTTLEFTQFQNSDGAAIDHFVVQSSKHGPFE